LRRYLGLCADGATEAELEQLTKGIYKDYISGEGMFSLPKNEIVIDLRSGQDSKGNICFELNENLFSDLFLFTIGGLEVYYDLFKQSKTYQHLREELPDKKFFMMSCAGTP